MNQVFLEDFPVKFLSHLHQNLLMFCGEVFETAKDSFFKFQTLLPVKYKTKEKKFIVRSDQAECIDMHHYLFITDKVANLNATSL